MGVSSGVAAAGLVLAAGLLGACNGGAPDQSRGEITGIIIAPPDCAGEAITVELVNETGVATSGSETVTLSAVGTASYSLSPDPQPTNWANYTVRLASDALGCGATTTDSPSVPYRLYKADKDEYQHNFAFSK